MTESLEFLDENPDYRVLLKRGEFVDSARGGRVVPFKIYHPADFDGGTCPVILWSHGFGGSRDGASFLSRYVAAFGYVIVHMTHVGTDSSLWEGKPGHPWDILRKAKVERATTLNRFRDVAFVLDQLKGWADENPEPGAFMDFERVGMSGHSFGALSTQVAAGQMFPDEDETYISLKEERIKAAISYSPVPIDHLGPDDAVNPIAPGQIYGPIDVPILYMTGTEDSSPIGGADYTHRFVVYEESSAVQKYMLVKNGGDHMVYNGTRGKLDSNQNRARHEEMIQVMSLAFWEAYLKGNGEARAWLDGVEASDYISEDGDFKVG